MSSFKSLNDVKNLIKKYPFPAGVNYKDDGDYFSVCITFIPGPVFWGTLPKTDEVKQFIQSHNWRQT